jgi:hypothetical protein
MGQYRSLIVAAAGVKSQVPLPSSSSSSSSPPKKKSREESQESSHGPTKTAAAATQNLVHPPPLRASSSSSDISSTSSSLPPLLRSLASTATSLASSSSSTSSSSQPSSSSLPLFDDDREDVRLALGLHLTGDDNSNSDESGWSRREVLEGTAAFFRCGRDIEAAQQVTDFQFLNSSVVPLSLFVRQSMMVFLCRVLTPLLVCFRFS